HWCHVMEKESFEDSEVASLLNNHFVSIKVDREERPDIDNIYMHISLLATGGGGWPLTILMTSDRQPFLVTTYLPKESTLGRIGLVDLLKKNH
ncbi:thioredoxin domain-containing protein, partial [Candidatus Bathyarchaeota archaeon]|nr:thioredoxin domain-containing protein [Candidatus Bathyarchaeota archaeon]